MRSSHGGDELGLFLYVYTIRLLGVKCVLFKIGINEIVKQYTVKFKTNSSKPNSAPSDNEIGKSMGCISFCAVKLIKVSAFFV